MTLMAVMLGGVVPAAGAAPPAGSAAENYEQALRAFEAGDVAQSVNALKLTLEQDPGLLPAHVLVARLYLRIGEAAAAEEALGRASQLGGDPNLLWPLRAEALARQFKFKELLALSPREGLEPEPQAKVLVIRGNALMEEGKDDEAESSFSAAARLVPTRAGPLVAMAVLALRRGDAFAAEAHAIKATQVAPEDAEAWAALGDVAHAQGKLDQATATYAEALARDAQLLDARISRAGIHLDRGELELANNDIARLREDYPLEPRSAYLEAVLLGKQGRHAESLEAFHRASALIEEMGASVVDRSVQLVLLAGLAHYELGQLEQAQRYLRRYIERFPDQSGPRKLLGSVLLRSGREAEAIVVLERALNNAPNDHRLLILLGAAYSQRGRHDLAGPYLEQAVKLSAGSPQLRARRAMNRVAAGFEKEGIEELQELFDANPAAQVGVGIALVTVRFKRGEYDAARAIAERLASVQPDNVMILNLLGSAQLRSGQRDAARRTFETVLALEDTFVPAKLNMGALSADMGQLEEARKLLLEALELRPESVQTMVSLARLARMTGNLDDALRWLQKAQGTQPRSIPVALALVDVYFDARNVADAHRIALDAESWAPGNLDAMAAVARTYLAQDRKDLAVDVYQRMSRVAGFDTRQLLRIARLQLDAGRVAEAIFTLEKGIKGDPEHEATRALLVALLIKEGRLAQAQQHVETLLASTPRLPAAHRLAGDIKLASGQAEAAVDYFRTALELAPGTLHALSLYGAQVSAGRVDVALAFLEGWVEGNPDDLAARLALGERYLVLDRDADARRQYEVVLDRDPHHINALNNMAYVLDRMGDSAAMAFAERALRLAPDDPAILDTFGWLLVRAGDPARGLSLLRSAYSRAASSAEIRYHIGAALAALGRGWEARQELRQALARSSDFSGADDARSLLERLEN